MIALAACIAPTLRGEAPSLCRLDYFSVCEKKVEAPSLSESQRQTLFRWAERYRAVPAEAPLQLAALSELPRSIRHALFLQGGRPLTASQVSARLGSLGIEVHTHSVLGPLLEQGAKDFGGERRFYTGLEWAIHRFLTADPGLIARLRTRLKPDGAKTTDTPSPPPSDPGRREVARGD